MDGQTPSRSGILFNVLNLPRTGKYNKLELPLVVEHVTLARVKFELYLIIKSLVVPLESDIVVTLKFSVVVVGLKPEIVTRGVIHIILPPGV